MWVFASPACCMCGNVFRLSMTTRFILAPLKVTLIPYEWLSLGLAHAKWFNNCCWGVGFFFLLHCCCSNTKQTVVVLERSLHFSCFNSSCMFDLLDQQLAFPKNILLYWKWKVASAMKNVQQLLCDLLYVTTQQLNSVKVKLLFCFMHSAWVWSQDIMVSHTSLLLLWHFSHYLLNQA